jgi:hypothetical protein
MKQLKISLPDDLRHTIERSAEAAGNSLGEEIRQRIERTLRDDAFDAPTRELGDDVRQLALAISGLKRTPWHANAKSHEALVSAVTAWLALVKPTASEGAADPWPPDDPRTVGRFFASLYNASKAAAGKGRWDRDVAMAMAFSEAVVAEPEEPIVDRLAEMAERLEAVIENRNAETKDQSIRRQKGRRA